MISNCKLILLLTTKDQMTIMIESSRTFLFTEYARSGCGTFKDQGTDPKVWDALPGILKQVKADNEARRERLETFYDDDRLAELVRR
ncbi:Homogentisate 1-2-dioxygenase [Penicillium maclennaniae]|uniref:Homogentisate 1-2-dioxygenase n=1 Tax=Penicillium maclennaniae TaxID=1343394 RepID=UPI002540FAE0|nr:Homogentisate 1-2-dioxygenase [Penicillium maclennaniae]KAJ5678290.1 Homogentisate 1-2-dioxygenase [Penicillium maclennaniae]